jgi:hypothetical protein
VWCSVVEGGDTGGYSPGVLVVVGGRSFPSVGDGFRTWACRFRR